MTTRATLPLRRRCETFELTHGGQNTPYQVTLGYYDIERDRRGFHLGIESRQHHRSSRAMAQCCSRSPCSMACRSKPSSMR